MNMISARVVGEIEAARKLAIPVFVCVTLISKAHPISNCTPECDPPCYPDDPECDPDCGPRGGCEPDCSPYD